MPYALPPGVLCRDTMTFERKLGALVQGGLSSLHIVSDFDLTLTRGSGAAKGANTVNSQIREGGYLGQGYRRDSLELRSKYFPMEMDPSLPLPHKRKAMLEWTRGILGHLQKHGLSREIIGRIGRECPFMLREGLDDLVAWSAKGDVPLVIFSAAVGDIIESALEEKGLLAPNLLIVANFLTFDEQGTMTGVREPVVSMFNKTEALLRGTTYERLIEGRCHVLLLGDSLGDIDMATGESHDVVLSVGFLNGLLDKRERYLDSFDVVIEEDSDLSFVSALLRHIEGTQ